MLLSGCAGEGVFPVSSLPAAPPGPPPPFPSFIAPSAANEDDTRVLTELEREEIEAQLGKIAQDREAGVRRRIERSK